MIPDRDRKWSPIWTTNDPRDRKWSPIWTANNPRPRLQMIPKRCRKWPLKWFANDPWPRTQVIPKMDRKWSPTKTVCDPGRKVNDRYCRPQMIPRGKSEWLGQKLLDHRVTVYYHNTKCKTNLQRLIGTTEKNHQTTETSSGHRISAKSVNKTLNCFKQHLTQVLSLGTDYYFVYSGSNFVEIVCGL